MIASSDSASPLLHTAQLMELETREVRKKQGGLITCKRRPNTWGKRRAETSHQQLSDAGAKRPRHLHTPRPRGSQTLGRKISQGTSNAKAPRVSDPGAKNKPRHLQRQGPAGLRPWGEKVRAKEPPHPQGATFFDQMEGAPRKTPVCSYVASIAFFPYLARSQGKQTSQNLRRGGKTKSSFWPQTKMPKIKESTIRWVSETGVSDFHVFPFALHLSENLSSALQWPLFFQMFLIENERRGQGTHCKLHFSHHHKWTMIID